jgi:hypothetical protein
MGIGEEKGHHRQELMNRGAEMTRESGRGLATTA